LFQKIIHHFPPDGKQSDCPLPKFKAAGQAKLVFQKLKFWENRSFPGLLGCPNLRNYLIQRSMVREKGTETFLLAEKVYPG
jgi:hypothetical protein